MSAPLPLDSLRFPLYGSQLIEASAGTGKTFTIAALYMRLVLGHGGDTGFGEPLLPPRILVVTFTEAATRELRDRIRVRLTEAAAHFRSLHSEPDPFLRALREDYPEAHWSGCARRLEIAAEWMDEAAVSTIHGWCNRMLREHAFDSGSLFTQALEPDQRELLAESVRDYWRTFVYAMEGPALSCFLGNWATPDSLLATIKELPRPEDDADAEEDPVALLERTLQQRQDNLDRLKSPWRAWADQLEDLLEQAGEDKAFAGNRLRRDHRRNWIEALRRWRDDPDLVRPELTDNAWHRLTPAGLAEIWKDGLSPPDHPALHALETLPAELARLPDPLPALRRHAAGWVWRRFRKEQQQRAQLGFDDLLTRLDEALRGANGERLGAVIRRQFPVALIDEFQDTDPVQYRIFDHVYRVEDSPRDQGLFMIGDPKQAIYAFRGADIFTYLQARRATAGRHYTLTRNFRSTPELVAAVNRVFGQAEDRAEGTGAFMFREQDDSPVPFLPVAAARQAEPLVTDGGAHAALTCWHASTGENVSKAEYTGTMAAACATEIVRLLNLGARERAGIRSDESGFRPLRPADVAVLVRDGREAEIIRRELGRRGVRSVYLSDKESVYHSPEARDMLFWLKACAEPDADRHLRAALGTATLGLDWPTLDRLNQDEAHWEDRVLQFREYRRLWRVQGVLPMLRRLMMDFRVHARLAARPDGERAITNLLHITELLQHASSEVDGEHALIRFLSDHLRDDGQAAEEQVVRLESDEALVKVVTIHKAKGMEYPLVFLPFICTYRQVSGDRPPARYHDGNGALVLDVNPDADALARADRERLAEDLRLLYVALTRARNACWLGIASLRAGRSRRGGLHLSALGYLLAAGAPIEAEALGEHLNRLRGNCEPICVTAPPESRPDRLVPDGGDAEPGPARVPVRAASEHWWIASYSALSSTTDDEPHAGDASRLPGAQAPDTPLEANLSETADEAGDGMPLRRPLRIAEGLHGFPRGPNPGTFLHGLLEWAAQETFRRAVEDPERLADTVARRCNRRGWDRFIDPLTRWLRAFLSMPIALPDAAPLVLRDLDMYQPELEFWFETRNVGAEELDRRVRQRTLDGRPRAPVQPRLLNGMLKGFIDLVIQHDGRYYVVDYKSNWLGEDDTTYSQAAMREAVLEKRYDLQYVLYTLAMHRLLKARLPGYDYQQHMGGAIYLFLRGSGAPGQGVFADRPPASLIQELDRLFSGAGGEGRA